MNISDFVSKLNQSEKLDSEGLELVDRAFNFAQKAHINQKRLSGEPYFNHCARTALSLSKLKLEPIIISAGLLHDTLEDTEITEEELFWYPTNIKVLEFKIKDY